jgi:hypothetical protein
VEAFLVGMPAPSVCALCEGMSQAGICGDIAALDEEHQGERTPL